MVSAALPLYQEAWEEDEETGLQITDGSQPPGSTNPGKITLLALSLQAHVWQCSSSTAITVGWFVEKAWCDSSPLLCLVPPAPSSMRNRAPPCADWDPCNATPVCVCVLLLPVGNSSCLAHGHFHGTWITLSCLGALAHCHGSGAVGSTNMVKPTQAARSESNCGAILFFFLATSNNQCSDCFCKMQCQELIGDSNHSLYQLCPPQPPDSFCILAIHGCLSFVLSVRLQKICAKMRLGVQIYVQKSMKNQSKSMLIDCTLLCKFRMDSYMGFPLLIHSILVLRVKLDHGYFCTVHIFMLVDP